jgi:predicted MFS family arabinose efflux permease
MFPIRNSAFARTWALAEVPRSEGASTSAGEVVTEGYARYVLALLVVVYAVNFIDRQLLSILLQPIKDELQVSDTAMGFLTGPAFALFYAFAGIPLARWADRGVRRSIIALGLAVWSGMTAFSGAARTFAHLALARVGVGVGEATCSPAAHSLIADYFPPERRATALAIYSTGIHIGILFGYSLGGWINEAFGWRAAFYVLGLPGLVLALIVRFTIKEPIRGASEGMRDTGTQPSTGETARFLGRLPSARHLTLAASFKAFAGYGAAVWTPAFLFRVHGMGTAEAGAWLGLITGFAGAAGAFFGGALVDRFAKRDSRFAMWIPGFASLASVPFSLVLYGTDWLPLALMCAVPSVFLSAIYLGPAFATAQNLAKLRMRAMSAAILIFVINLIGLGLGPQAVGIFTDLLDARFGDHAIRYSLMSIQATMLLLAGLHFFLGARTLREDLRAKEAA